MKKEDERKLCIDLVIWDCDGTLTTVTSAWQWIHEHLGTWDRGKQHLNDFLEQRITYEEFACNDASEWKGMSENDLRKILMRIPLRDDQGTALLYFKRTGLKQVLISSGLSLLTQHITSLFPVFDQEIANELLMRNGKVSGEVIIRVPWGGKAHIAKQICQSFNTSPSNCLAIGDSPSDLSLFRFCGYSIALDAPEDVAHEATKSVKDIRDIPRIYEQIVQGNQ